MTDRSITADEAAARLREALDRWSTWQPQFVGTPIPFSVDPADLTVLLAALTALKALLAEAGEGMEPFGQFPEFHDLEDDIVVLVNAGEAITAGDFRRARTLRDKIEKEIAG